MRRLKELFFKCGLLYFIGSIIAFNLSCTEKIQPIQIPKTKAALDGWQGIKIRKCGPKCCELVFPHTFGLNNKIQLMSLRSLVNAELVHDVDCMMLVNIDALNQIKFLAVEKKDQEAARMLLSPMTYGGFNLDGEVAEQFVEDYQLVILEKFDDLPSILNRHIEEELSIAICSWLEVSSDELGRKRINKLIKKLKSKNLNEFIEKITSKCGQSL